MQQKLSRMTNIPSKKNGSRRKCNSSGQICCIDSVVEGHHDNMKLHWIERDVSLTFGLAAGNHVRSLSVLPQFLMRRDVDVLCDLEERSGWVPCSASFEHRVLVNAETNSGQDQRRFVITSVLKSM